MTTPDTTNNPRALAEERLSHLSSLQMRMQRRGGPGHSPVRDGRGGQGRVLALLAMNPEISQRELTYLLRLSRQALAELLTKLEQKGLIERTQSEADRRTMLVTLTDSGREAAQKIDERMQEPSTLLDSLDDDEVARLADYLGRIIGTLETQFEERWQERRQQCEDGTHGHPHGGGRGGHGRGCRSGDPEYGHRHHHRGGHHQGGHYRHDLG